MTTACYTLIFADGKRCTAIDPDREEYEQAAAGFRSQFKPGYLVEVILNEQYVAEVDRGKSGEV